MSAASQLLTYRALAEAPPNSRPQIALIVGSGMSAVVRRLKNARSLPFAQVPGMAAPSVEGHPGALTVGDWAGRRILVFEGRLHYYEGHSWRNVVAPVQTAAYLGARFLLLTNAAGGIHDALAPGNLMAIRDHIEWTRPFCWRLPGPGGIGFERASPYSPLLLKQLMLAADAVGIKLHQGTYAAVTGPCYETPAEVRALKGWGADAVGMSTAREIQTGYELGLECAALSCITNRAAGLSVGPINHEEVLTTAAAEADRLGKLLEAFLGLL